MEIKLPEFERMIRHRTEITCICNFDLSSKKAASQSYGSIQFWGGTALLAVYLKLLNSAIVRLVLSFGKIKKNNLLFTLRKTSLPLLPTRCFLHWDIKLSFQCTASKRQYSFRPQRQYIKLGPRHVT